MKSTVEEVCEMIRTYLDSKRNLAVARYSLVLSKQNNKESFDDWYTTLRKLAISADLWKMKGDDWLATLIICGVKDDDVRRKLLEQCTTLELKETLNICRSQETAKNRQTGIQNLTNKHINAVSTNSKSGDSTPKPEVKSQQKSGKSRSKSRNRNSSSKSNKKCRRCEKDYPHPDGQTCPTLGHTCNVCKKKGHFEKACFTAKKDVKKTNVILIGNVNGRSGSQNERLLVNIYHGTNFLGNAVMVPDKGVEVIMCGLGLIDKFELSV